MLFEPNVAWLQSILHDCLYSFKVVRAVLCTHTCVCTYTHTPTHVLHTQDICTQTYTSYDYTVFHFAFCFLFYLILCGEHFMMPCKHTSRKQFDKLCFFFFKLNFKQISLETLFSIVEWPLSSGLQTYDIPSPHDPTSWALLPGFSSPISASSSSWE